MNFLTQFFASPGMLAGTLLVSVPVLIYLINRRRFQRRKWAAMEFLLRAMQKNRRRLQLENLLLLLIRCAIIALLAAAMARPFVRHSVFSRLSTQPENWIFAIDTSYSMEYREGTRSVFETARESMAKLVQTIVKSGDQVAVVSMDQSARELVSPTVITEASRASVIQAIEGIEVGSGALNVPAALRGILELAKRFEALAGAPVALSEKKLILFTDFQRKDWLDDNGPKDPAVRDLVEAMRNSGIRISRADLRKSDRNLTVSDLDMSPVLASQDVWMEFAATVRNFGKEDFDAVEIAFAVDGVEERTHVARVPAGGAVTRHLPYRFTAAGHHSVVVELRGDGLAADNARYLAVEVRESADLLVIDGEPGDTEIDRETLLLDLALRPEESDDFRRAPYRPLVQTPDQAQAADSPLDGYLAVILANVSARDLGERFVDDLRRYVEQGGALLVFLGKNVEPEEYNRIFRRRNGDLLPVPLGSLVQQDLDPAHPVSADPRHPVMRYFHDRSDYTYLEQPYIEFRRFFRLLPDVEQRDFAAMLRFDDPAESLAAIDAPCGRGRVFWFASTIDLEWNDFAKYPDFIPFLHEVIPYLVRHGATERNLRLGQPYQEIFGATEFAPDVSVVPPPRKGPDGLDAAAAIPRQLAKMENENRFILMHEETMTPGLYEVRLDRGPGVEDRERRHLFAVNVDPAEGDLRVVSAEVLRESFPALEMEAFDAEKRVQDIARDRGAAMGTELWRFVLWGVLALLIAESVVAMAFGRRQV